MKKLLTLIILWSIQMNAQLPEIDENRCTQKVIGTVFQNASQKKIGNAYVSLKDYKNNVLKTVQTDKKAKYFFMLECNRRYSIQAEHPKYTTAERVVITTTTNGAVGKKDMFLNPKLKNGKKREYLYIGTVDFEYNEWKVLPRYMYELNKAVRFMKANPNLVIHIESHTDSRAPSDFNMELCKKRIEVLEEYLGFREIFRRRITGVAFGETKPINRCVKGVKCQDEEYLENRRTIFTLKERKKK